MYKCTVHCTSVKQLCRLHVYMYMITLYMNTLYNIDHSIPLKGIHQEMTHSLHCRLLQETIIKMIDIIHVQMYIASIAIAAYISSQLV